MKKSIIGSLIGIAIVVAADTIIRVILSISLESELSPFLYNLYPGITWSLFLCASTLVTSFLGGAFAVTYTNQKKKLNLIIFGVWLMAVRYGQIHLAMERELLLPIVALVFSLLSIVLVWRFFLRKNKSTVTEHTEPSADPGAANKKHHSPNVNQEL